MYLFFKPDPLELALAPPLCLLLLGLSIRSWARDLLSYLPPQSLQVILEHLQFLLADLTLPINFLLDASRALCDLISEEVRLREDLRLNTLKMLLIFLLAGFHPLELVYVSLSSSSKTS